ALVATSVSAAAGSTPSIQTISDSQLQAMTTTTGGVAGAPALNTSDTIPHWFGSTVNGNNGVTYGFNMVGANPNTCSGSACDTTIEADVQPLIVTVQGMTFDGTKVMDATLNSPEFQLNDYGSTSAATSGNANENRGAGGALSQNDAGNLLQLEDATMRAQFNQTGASPYHVRLHPNVLPPASISVPSDHGVLLQSGRGVIFADVDIKWWSARIQELQAHADAHHLPIYTTNNVLLHIGPNVLNCCVIGFHGAGIATGSSKAVNGSGHGNGNQQVQTFAWATYLQPGIYARPNGGTDWAVQDIHPLSHEISEWADDPFVNNFVQPWLTPTAPQYGCTGVLETGDPVVGIGFAQGTNTFEQGPNPNGTQSADGAYHPEDEVYLPWFMRTSPNTISEANQTTAGGRYTLMGDLNRFPGFHVVATGC
ncbi:MAG TPA: hypothetical protein VJT78_10455, partial [Candidatus Dormibacteraeota bacterium]|nr:hypothetical protein [Candidatus Dormibacteraeota bacterium]